LKPGEDPNSIQLDDDSDDEVDEMDKPQTRFAPIETKKIIRFVGVANGKRTEPYPEMKLPQVPSHGPRAALLWPLHPALSGPLSRPLLQALYRPLCRLCRGLFPGPISAPF